MSRSSKRAAFSSKPITSRRILYFTKSYSRVIGLIRSSVEFGIHREPCAQEPGTLVKVNAGVACAGLFFDNAERFIQGFTTSDSGQHLPIRTCEIPRFVQSLSGYRQNTGSVASRANGNQRVIGEPGSADLIEAVFCAKLCEDAARCDPVANIRYKHSPNSSEVSLKLFKCCDLARAPA